MVVEIGLVVFAIAFLSYAIKTERTISRMKKKIRNLHVRTEMLEKFNGMNNTNTDIRISSKK